MLEFTVPTLTMLPEFKESEKRRRVVLVTVPDGDPFDLIGPLTVLRDTNWQLESSGRPDLGYDIEVVTNTPGSIFEAHGMSIVVEKSCYDIEGPVDTMVFQAVDYEERCLEDRKFIDWVASVAPTTRRMVTACIGTYVLAQAGLLKGRRATTHWASCHDFNDRYDGVDLDPEPIFVKDGKFYSSAGITSILDLMLALVEEDFGPEAALRVAQSMVMFLRRPASQSQFSVQMQSRLPKSDGIRTVTAYIAQYPDRDLSIPALAEIANMSPRNFARVFTRETSMTPGKYVELSRVEAARSQLEQSQVPIKKIAKRCGYVNLDSFRSSFDRNLGVGPSEYRRRFASSEQPVA